MRGHPCSDPGVQAQRGLSLSITPRPPPQGSVACYRDTRGLPRKTRRPQLPADLQGEQALVAASRGPPTISASPSSPLGGSRSPPVLRPSQLRASRGGEKQGEGLFH